MYQLEFLRNGPSRSSRNLGKNFGALGIKKRAHLNELFAKKLLADKDSNLERDNQNVLCYHYTISQYRVSGAKVIRVF